MKNLTWIPLLAGLALAGACGDDSGGDDDDDDTFPDAFVPTIDAAPTVDAPPVTGAAVTVNWPLTSGIDSTPGASCPAGATTAVIDFDELEGTDFHVLYDCADGTGVENIPPGDYLVWVTLQNDAKTETYAMSAEYPLVLTATDTAATVTAPINIDSGFFYATWSFSPAGRTCATVGADGVSLLVSIADDVFALDTILVCDNGEGTTDGIPLSDNGYVIQVSLLDGDTPLGSSQSSNQEPFRWANEVVDIGNFEFAVE
jgi:hypothetical protein